MVCIPYTIENLHQMADELGIKRGWFHRSRLTGLWHYDMPKRRVKEIMARCHVVPSAMIILIARGMLNDFYFSRER